MTHAAADASPFSYTGDRRGVLLVHGFSGTPFEMTLLGASLAARGYTVRAPALAGHGPGALNLGGTTWPDWLRSVEDAFDELRSTCDTIGVCGLSLGGLLTLELARLRGPQVTAIAVLSAALFLPAWQIRVIRLASRTPVLRRLILPKLAGSDIADSAMRKRNPRPAGGMPFRTLGSLVDIGAHVRAHLDQIDQPAFIAHGAQDHVVPAACSDEIAARLPHAAEVLRLPRSFHLITLDVERAFLFQRIGDFFDHQLGPPAAERSDPPLHVAPVPAAATAAE